MEGAIRGCACYAGVDPGIADVEVVPECEDGVVVAA